VCASNCCRARTEARRTRRCGQQSLDRPSPGPPGVQGSALASQRKKSRQRAPVAPRGSSPRRPAFLMRPLAESGRKQLDQMTRLPSAPAEDADVRPVFFGIAFKSMCFGHFDQRAGCKGVTATRQFWGPSGFLPMPRPHRPERPSRGFPSTIAATSDHGNEISRPPLPTECVSSNSRLRARHRPNSPILVCFALARL
jgi:hypothetical protein